MHITPCGMSGWMKHRLELRLLGEVSITSDTQKVRMAESEEELKRLHESERGE